MSLEKTHCIVEIDSRERYSGTINQFEIRLNYPIDLNRNRQYFCRMENIRKPTSFYNIDSNYNKLVVIENTGGTADTLTITVDEGNYTINELLTELKTLLDTASQNSNTYTFTIDDITGKVTISTNTTDFKIDGTASTMMLPLGFSEGTDYTSSGSPNTLTSVNHIIMSTKRYLKIDTNLTSNNHYTASSIERIGCVVPITESRSTIQYYSNDNGYKTKMEKKHHIKDLSFEVKDGNNKPVDFNGVDWNAELVIYEARGLGQ